MRVAVVGLGLAGLAAARTLRAGGAEVVAFEAQRHVGGRVQSVGLGNLVWESGGEWIDSDHPRIQALLREFGLEPILAAEGTAAIHYQGALIHDGAWPDVVEEEERLEHEANRRAAALADPLWTEEAQVGLDHVPLRAFVDSIVTTPRGRWLAGARLRSDEGEDLERVGTLGWLGGWRNYLKRPEGAMSALRSPVGLAGLAQRLLTTLDVDLRLGVRVSEIDATDTGVEIAGERFDRVVVALPPRAIERIRFTHPLPADTRCAIEGIGAARAVKIALRFQRPFWLERGFSGRVLSDGPLQQLWAGPRPEEGVLHAYVVGNGAHEWTVLDHPIAAARYEIGQIFPEAPELFLEGALADWTVDGAFPYLPSGYVTGHLAALGQPVGPIHWAGDWCAPWFGFAEGALESGERAAQKILSGETLNG